MRYLLAIAVLFSFSVYGADPVRDAYNVCKDAAQAAHSKAVEACKTQSDVTACKKVADTERDAAIKACKATQDAAEKAAKKG